MKTETNKKNSKKYIDSRDTPAAITSLVCTTNDGGDRTKREKKSIYRTSNLDAVGLFVGRIGGIERHRFGRQFAIGRKRQKVGNALRKQCTTSQQQRLLAIADKHAILQKNGCYLIQRKEARFGARRAQLVRR